LEHQVSSKACFFRSVGLYMGWQTASVV
jgi:hypothetical protein